ncbi:MAG: hypothetical protein NTZ78_00945 [Candidatus Aureabacteria bacterium]|nr:hypothetical protein [Candidatus Auribacterota bacterium]
MPIQKPSWSAEAMADARARLGADVEIITTYPPTKANGPFFSSCEDAFCLVRFDLDEATHGAYLDAVRNKRFRLTATTFRYPTYPIIQLVLRIQPDGWSSPWYQEVIGNVTDEDIQRFIVDACRTHRWTLVLAQYDPVREKQTRRMVNCLETAVAMSRSDVAELANAALAAASHFREVAADRRDFNAAAREFLIDSPAIDTSVWPT